MTSYPVPRREEDRVFYAGAPPPGWDTAVPRQSEESNEKLLDPPVAVPDPYGWLRDMKRENPEVLDHLKAENEYTQKTISHLEPLQEKLYDEFLSSIQEVSFNSWSASYAFCQLVHNPLLTNPFSYSYSTAPPTYCTSRPITRHQDLVVITGTTLEHTKENRTEVTVERQRLARAFRLTGMGSKILLSFLGKRSI